MKKIISIICCFSALFWSFNCFALSSDDVNANLITSQGKTGIVKEYSNVITAINNAKSGDTVELTANLNEKIEICVDKNITLSTGEKRTSNIIIGSTVKPANVPAKSLQNVSLKDNGKDFLITFKNINVNGNYISVTGDTNSDGSVNLLDLVKLKKNISENKPYSANSDINLDSAENAQDLVLLSGILLEKY